MNTGIVTMRYAKAMLEYTEHEGVSGEVYKEMESLARSFELEPRLRTFLMNPMLTSKDKAGLLESAVGERASRQMKRFLQLVIRNQREELLHQIALNFLELYRRSRNITLAYIETAVPIPGETQKRIKEYLGEKTHGEIWLDLHVNPAIIGGFIFRMNFREIDASITSQLKRIKKEFKNEIGRML